MKIVVDNKIPYIKGALEPFSKVVYLPGAKISNDVVRDADALIIRTRTLCNEKLLRGSRVKFIATATIGYDHIDIEYCRKEGIAWNNAPGCNAESVNQYIASALFSFALRRRLKLRDQTIGIVGVGNVGSRVSRLCSMLGMKVLLNDPPRQRREGPQNFVSLEMVQGRSDIITLHVPLNMNGQDATYQMVNEDFLHELTKKPLLINSCRGEVVKSTAVSDAIYSGNLSGFIADCWENEPVPDIEFINLSDYATPHIAGYSRDGKANGTAMSIRAVSNFFSLGLDNWFPEIVERPENTMIEIDGKHRDEESVIAEAILSTYDIEKDDDAFRENPHDFEKLRGDYPVRREFTSYTIKAKNVPDETLNKLKEMGFKIDRN